MGSGSSKAAKTGNTNAHNNASGSGANAAGAGHGTAENTSPAKPAATDVKNPAQQQTKAPEAKDVSASQGAPAATSQKKQGPSKVQEKKGENASNETGQGVDPEALLPQDQAKFDSAIRFASLLIKPESIMKHATKGVQKLELKQALPHTISLFSLLQSLPNLQILDVSGNQMGPPAFRALMLSLCHNSTITTLNIADNQTDTDSAESIGKMLGSNRCLTCLDVSGNYLGLDFFSRCVGPALAHNNVLQMLKCESIGSTDLNVLGENVKKNISLTSLNISSNELSNPKALLENLTSWLQAASCSLKTLQMRGTGLKNECLDILAEGLHSNTTLETLDISANQCAKASSLMNVVLSCVTHAGMTTLTADDVRPTSCDAWTPAGAKKLESPSHLRTLSCAGCSLKDDYVTILHDHVGDGAMPGLVELNVANNTDLTTACLGTFAALTCPPKPDEPEEEQTQVQTEPTSGIKRLSYGHNNGESLSDVLMSSRFPRLAYLNLRRTKMSASALEKLAPLFGKNGTVETLVLDGLKLAGTGVFAAVLAKDNQLAAVSVASCQLNDADLASLCAAVKAGLGVRMLKLSDNRITDGFVCSLCDALQAKKTHPLALIDMSSNNITTKGAKRFTDMLSSKHKSQLHSLNLSFNGIDAAGVTGLAGCVGKTSLQSLNVSNQSCSYYEEDCDNIYKQIAKSLGLKVVEENGGVKRGCCDLPKLPDFLSYKLTSLGGCPGELGKALQSRAIVTDYGDQKALHLTLHDALQIAAHLKGQDSPDTVFSSEEWSTIIGTKDSPTWLQVATHRERALFMSRLPASITSQKMEGILEMEADCNVEEVCLMKDMVTRKNNGLAWVLLSDGESVNRAVEFYDRGDALVFSVPFTISRVRVHVDDEASSDVKARQDIAARSQEKRKEEAEHRALIEQSYLESQARHAYRLAHPAYADGRIW